VDPSKDFLSDEWKGVGWKTKKSGSGANPPPVGLADSKKAATAVPSGPHGSKVIEEGLYEGALGTPKSYDPELMAGLPTGVQIVGKLYEDEKVLELMKIVDDALGERGFGPGSSAKWIS
jgi:amidase